MRRKKLSLKSTLFIVILSVAIVCIVTSAVLAIVLASREVNKRLEEPSEQVPVERRPGQPTPPPPPRPAPGSIPPWLWMVFLFAGMAGLVVAMGLSLWMANRISKPLSELTATTASITEGEYGEKVEVSGGREIEELATAFNTLSEKLERNEKLRQNMVADIAHELRTPLTTLRGDFEAVKDGLIEPDSAVLDNLLGDILVLTRLVEDLQQVSLAEAGQLKLELAQVDTKTLVDDVASRFENEIAGKQISLNIETDPSLMPIRADRLRISQVLGNLIKNSLLHTPEGGSITVSAVQSGREVILSVADTGPGIAPDELPYIFERFYRADKSRMRKTGGSGLGLTIARTLVKAHGGRIWAKSEIGKGTTISFSVPIIHAAG